LHPDFHPDLTPEAMLALGVFGGKYMTDCREEFPESWFRHARLSPGGRNTSLNCFGVDASQPLSVWRAKGWIHPDDPRGSVIAAISTDADCQAKTSAKSVDGKPCDATSRRSGVIASRVTSGAGAASVKHCCIGLMTAERFEPLNNV
jgi:hypothetical protein